MEKTKYVFERLVTLDPSLVQFFYVQKATQKGSPKQAKKTRKKKELGSHKGKDYQSIEGHF